MVNAAPILAEWKPILIILCHGYCPEITWVTSFHLVPYFPRFSASKRKHSVIQTDKHYIHINMDHCSAFAPMRIQAYSVSIKVSLGFQFSALYISPCMLSLCLQLFSHTISHIIRLQMTYKYKWLLLQLRYPSYFILCSNAKKM